MKHDTAQPTVAICFCGATARNKMHPPTGASTSFDYPPGWTKATTETPGIPTAHGGMLVCAVCPKHAKTPDGWKGEPLVVGQFEIR